MKILNLYSGIGGNRYKWGDNHDITAVEWDEELAILYQERFPKDKVIVSDAHQYLLDNYKEFDFIWSSPPCPTHSRARYWSIGANGKSPIYPDMSLYQQILLLDFHFRGYWVVENVVPYYKPIFNPKKRNRHLYWTNFNLPNDLGDRTINVCQGKDELNRLCIFHEYNFKNYKGKQSILKIARNLVDYIAGKTILDTAMGIMTKQDTTQTELF
jgi:DNA (cytosine-5)-methyltransferase 1